MAEIGGSLIQRSFVANDVGNIIHIATVPIDELDLDEANPTSSIAEILGAPRSSIFSEEDYQTYRNLINRASRRGRESGSFRSQGIRFDGSRKESRDDSHPLFEDFILYVSSTSVQQGGSPWS